VHRIIPASAILALLVCVTGAQAQTPPRADYPTRPIRLIVPFAPGGGVDLLGRLIAQRLNDAWGQAVVVDNRGGAGGNTGTGLVAKSAPDGYTLLMGYVGNLAINPFLFSNLAYDPRRDFAAVTMVATAPNLLVAHPSLAATTVKDLVALARARPGQLNYASAGNGTVGHMAAELFKTVTGLQITHIPYKGNGAAITDVLAGQVQLIFSAPGAVLPHVRAGKLKALATASRQRPANLADVPTFAESGFTEVEATAWYALFAPAGTPAPIVQRLNGETGRMLALPEIRERLATAGYDAVSSTPAELQALVLADLTKWAKVVKASGARVD